MKKLILLFGLVAFVATASFAQTEKDAPAEKEKIEKAEAKASCSKTAKKGACCSKDKGTASAGKSDAKASCSDSKAKASCCSKDKGTASAGKADAKASCSDKKGKSSCCSKGKGTAAAGKAKEEKAEEKK